MSYNSSLPANGTTAAEMRARLQSLNADTPSRATAADLAGQIANKINLPITELLRA